MLQLVWTGYILCIFFLNSNTVDIGPTSVDTVDIGLKVSTVDIGLTSVGCLYIVYCIAKI